MYGYQERVLKSIESKVESQKFNTNDMCILFNKLNAYNKNLYFSVFNFLGCNDLQYTMVSARYVSEMDRLRIVKIMLLSLNVATEEPRWSSWLIDEIWKIAFSLDNSSLLDIFKPLQNILHEYHISPSMTIINFIEDITYTGHFRNWKKYKSLYDENVLDWFLKQNINDWNSSESYLMVYIAPLGIINFETSVQIVVNLIEADFPMNKISFAIDNLKGNFQSPQLEQNLDLYLNKRSLDKYKPLLSRLILT